MSLGRDAPRTDRPDRADAGDDAGRCPTADPLWPGRAVSGAAFLQPHRAETFISDPAMRDIFYLSPPDRALVLCTTKRARSRRWTAASRSPMLTTSVTAPPRCSQPSTRHGRASSTAAEFHRRDGPFFAVTIRWMAANQSHRQAAGAWSRGPDRARQRAAMSAWSCSGRDCIDRGFTDPPSRNAPDGRSRGRRSRLGQRSRTSAVRHCSSVPKASRNASSLRPRTRDATLNPIAVTPSFGTY